ncbi:MAG: hypothetical protein H7301_04640 [Cryobacterium sp.]|nr:hypothetical protein [Oligoflexia bacterium]
MTGFTELHRHLDVSVRLSTLLELAQERGLVPLSDSLPEFRQKFILNEPMRDLATVLANFSLFPQVLDRPEVLERAAFEACEDAYQEGTRTLEFRYSPGFVTSHSKLPWIDTLDAFEAGLLRAKGLYPDLSVGLICIGSRDLGIDSIAESVDFFLKHQTRFIGMDLAGDEAEYPNRLYGEIMKPVVQAGASITIHAGEASGPDSVWAAIEYLGATRIGHGIRSIEDSQLLTVLRDRQIFLENCPISNRVTSAWLDYATHPFKTFLDFGIPVSLNTDDPGIFGNTLNDEIGIAREVMGVSDANIRKSFHLARKHSFLKGLTVDEYGN